MDEVKHYREFTVTPGVVGFKVRMGCIEAYFGDAESLARVLESWLSNPDVTEQSFLNNDQRHSTTGFAPPPVASFGVVPAASPGFRGIPTPV